jgi:hypothetical protein
VIKHNKAIDFTTKHIHIYIHKTREMNKSGDEEKRKGVQLCPVKRLIIGNRRE